MEERLRKFAYLVDAGSFTKAAEELHISQPALSSAIAKLERELRTSLLVRGSRSLQLTRAGRVAYAAAKELIVHTGNLTTRLAVLSREQLPVALGMIDSVADALFSSEDNVSRLEQQARVSVAVNNSRYLLQAVAHDKLDLAFIAERPGGVPGVVEASYVVSEPMVLVCHANMMSVVRAAVARGELPYFVSYDQLSNSRRLIAEALRQNGLESEPSFFSTSPDVILRLVLLQKGVAALPYMLVRDLVHKGELSLVGNPKPIIIERRIVSVKRRDKELSAPLEHTIYQIQDLLNQHYAEALQLAG